MTRAGARNDLSDEGSEIAVAGVALVADCAGALYWPEEGALLVADLHLEKGSSFAARGVLLPPYDTAAALARLARLIAAYAPRVVIALGDSFHDGAGPARLGDGDRAALGALQRGRDWIWITGNHDPQPADGIGGSFGGALALGPLVFRHQPTGAAGEVAGHLHPVARVSGRGRTVSRRCFAERRRAAGDARLRRLCGRPQRARPRLRRRVRLARLHRAHAGRGAPLRIAGARCLPD